MYASFAPYASVCFVGCHASESHIAPGGNEILCNSFSDGTSDFLGGSTPVAKKYRIFSTSITISNEEKRSGVPHDDDLATRGRSDESSVKREPTCTHRVPANDDDAACKRSETLSEGGADRKLTRERPTS